MDPIVANALIAHGGFEFYQNILGNRMPWNFQPMPLNDAQRTHIAMSIERCEEIYAGLGRRPDISEEQFNEAVDTLNNVVYQLENVENAQHFQQISQTLQAEINYLEAKWILGNEDLQFFDDDLENNGQPWPERRRDARRG